MLTVAPSLIYDLPSVQPPNKMVLPVTNTALSSYSFDIFTEPEYLGRSLFLQLEKVAFTFTFLPLRDTPLAITKAEVLSAASLAALATLRAATA